MRAYMHLDYLVATKCPQIQSRNCLVQSKTYAPTGNRDLEIAPTLRSGISIALLNQSVDRTLQMYFSNRFLALTHSFSLTTNPCFD